jgi:chromosome segregation ATPase
MSLWKYSFGLASKELEVTKKKKKALDNLFESDKISQSTYNYLDTELTKAISELEEHLKSLKDRMTSRTQELERQVSTLELFLASLEIHHAAGDVDDETYEKQNNAILLGLEATKQELDEIEASSKIISQPGKPSAALGESEEPAADVEEEEEELEIEEEDDPETDDSDLVEPSSPAS